MANDTHGYCEGHLAIREAAALLESTFRASDLVARVGGDEICVPLPGGFSAEEPVTRLAGLIDPRNAGAPARMSRIRGSQT